MLEALEWVFIVLGPLPGLLPAIRPPQSFAAGAFALFWPFFYPVLFMYLNSVVRPRIPDDCDTEAAGKALSRQHSFAVIAAFLSALMGFSALFVADPYVPRWLWILPASLYLLYLFTAGLSYAHLRSARRIIAEAPTQRAE